MHRPSGPEKDSIAHPTAVHTPHGFALTSTCSLASRSSRAYRLSSSGASGASKRRPAAAEAQYRMRRTPCSAQSRSSSSSTRSIQTLLAGLPDQAWSGTMTTGRGAASAPLDVSGNCFTSDLSLSIVGSSQYASKGGLMLCKESAGPCSTSVTRTGGFVPSTRSAQVCTTTSRVTRRSRQGCRGRGHVLVCCRRTSNES